MAWAFVVEVLFVIEVKWWRMRQRAKISVLLVLSGGPSMRGGKVQKDRLYQYYVSIFAVYVVSGGRILVGLSAGTLHPHLRFFTGDCGELHSFMHARGGLFLVSLAGIFRCVKLISESVLPVV